MRSLFSRAFAAILFSHIIMILVLSGIFVLAIQRSVENWNVHRGRRLQNLMAPEIARTYRLNGKLSETEIHSALRPFLSSSAYVYLVNEQRRPVYFYAEGERISVHDPELINAQVRAFGEAFSTPVSVLDGSEIVGYLYADSLGFRHDMANQHLIHSLFSVFLGGTAVSVAIALLVAYLFSRLLTHQSTELSQGIGRLAAGYRDVNFPIRGASELRSIAASAAKLQEQLSTEERLRQRWTQDIAHDLRTPISALKTQFEGMADGYLVPSEERFHQLQAQLLRIERLVNDLRELSRIESPEMTLECTIIDALSFVEELRSSFVRREVARGKEFRLSCGVTRLRADEHLLERALSNVLDNAFRYAREDGHVRLDLAAEDGYAVFTIGNAGYVEPRELEKVFERFFRGEEARTTSGSGLGLSIARAIVQLHGGAIRMEQDQEETMVIIRIPQPLGVMRDLGQKSRNASV
ncbi:MAG: sensor histidine kinase [Spirochaetaceae bacterium]